jgi:hypothetical protein
VGPDVDAESGRIGRRRSGLGLDRPAEQAFEQHAGPVVHDLVHDLVDETKPLRLGLHEEQLLDHEVLTPHSAKRLAGGFRRRGSAVEPAV